MLLKRILPVLAFPLALTLISCEGVDCEEEGTGILNWKNTKTTEIVVEVDGQVKNIDAGETETFNNVAAGICTADITYNGTKSTGVRFAECVSVCKTTNLEY